MSNVDAIFKSANKILVLKTVTFLSSNKSSGEGSLQSLDVHARMQKVLAEGVQHGRFLLLLLLFYN